MMSVNAWQKFAIFVSKHFITKRYHVQYEYQNIEPDIKGPFLILGNHTSVFDPFLLRYGLRQPIYFVTSDLYFRDRFLGYLATKAGCIPKAKFVSDFRVIRQLMQYAKEGKAIGIYPEGYCTWSGETDKFLPGIEKLIQLLKIPVITVATNGGYLTKPRWGKYIRRGKIILHYKQILSPQQIIQLPRETISKILHESLHQNDYDWQRGQMIPFNGEKTAETLELLLYYCPHCGKFETLTSADNIVTCATCGYRAVLNPYGFFEPCDRQRLYFDNANEWYQTGKMKLRQFLRKHTDNEIIFKRKMTLLQEQNKFSEFKKTDIGICMLFKNKIVFHGEKMTHSIPFRELKGFTLSGKNLIDFYYHDIKYRLNPNNHTLSGLLWEDAFKLCTEELM